MISGLKRALLSDISSPPASTQDILAPVSASERIASIDVLRGVALFGILLMNIVAFGLPGAAYSNPTVAGGATGANLAFWAVCQVLVEGKMRALFSMLFGAGVVLLTSRIEERGGGVRAADIYYRRTLWLILFGALHAYFIWSGDILYGYGVAGLFLFPFRRQSPRFLMLAGLLILAVMIPKSVLEGRRLETLRATAAVADKAAAAGRTLTDEQFDAQMGWRETLKEMKPTPAQVKEEVADHRAGYRKLFVRRMDEVSQGESAGFYRFGFFDVVGMMLLGMGLFKLGVFSGARGPRFYASMSLIGYGVGVPINWYIAHRDVAKHFEPAQMFFGYSGYDIGRLTVALGHAGIVMILCQAGVLRPLTSRLAAVGRMALTNYLATSVACTLLFDGLGLGWFGRLQRIQLLYVVLPIWIAQLILSPIWLRHFRFGPMEWVWRSLTHWRRQPMRWGALEGEAEIKASGRSGVRPCEGTSE
jgi:uncharacterized protein